MALLLPWVMAVIAARRPVRDNSFLWHITAGAFQNDGGAVLVADPFSFTFAGESWRTQSWLADIAYDVLHGAFDLGFVPPFLALAGLITFALVLVSAFRESGSVEAVAVTGVLTIWLGAVFLNPRPVIASYLLLAAVVAVAGRDRLRWVLPVIVWVWAAVHGSFVLGIGYVVLDALRRRDRRAFGDVAAMTLVATLTAHGVGIWQILLDFGGSREALGLITEWRTPNLTGVELAPFLIGIVVILLGGIQGRVRTADLWIIVPFLVFGLAATRSVFPAWIALAPLVARSLGGLPAATRSPTRVPVPLAVIAAALVVAPLVLPLESGISDQFPIDAAEHLDSERVFHDDRVGGYLIYRFAGTRPVFVDDRAELYGGDHFADVIATRNGTPEWRDVFAEWDISQVIVDVDDGLVAALSAEGWVEGYRDDAFVVIDAP